MIDEPRPAWPDPEWVDLVLGVDAVAARVQEAFRVGAWEAPPLPVEDDVAPATAMEDAGDELLDLLLGMVELADRVRGLVDRCADAAVEAPSPVEVDGGSLLR